MTTPRERFEDALVWTGAFGLNLPVPLVAAGFLADSPAQWAGVGGGLIVLWGGGLAAAFVGGDVRVAALKGALALAAFQVVPCLHAVAVGVARSVWDATAGPGGGAEAGFAVTLMTGVPLFAWAAAAGAVLHYRDPLRDRPPPGVGEDAG